MDAWSSPAQSEEDLKLGDYPLTVKFVSAAIAVLVENRPNTIPVHH